MKKNNKLRLASIILCMVLFFSITGMREGYAATNVSISAGQSQVAVGKTVSVTITVPSGTEAWTYKVSYSSDCLNLSSGTLEPMGFEGESSRTNTLIFTATKVGTAKVSVSGAKGLSIGGKDYDASGSVSISVVAVSSVATPTPTKAPSSNSGDSTKPTPTPTTKPTPTPEDSRSANNSLASLSLSQGTLSPGFDSSTTSYSVSLTAKVTSINVSATASDSKATVKGTGDVELKPGENTIDIVVTAENGATKTYTITANVDESPLVYTQYEGKSLGVVRKTKDLTIPDGFEETEVTLEGEQVIAWTNQNTGVTLLYLVDEEDEASFYVFLPDNGVLCKHVTFTYNDVTYTFAGVEEGAREVEGLIYGKVDAFDNTIDGFTYKDEELSQFAVLYLIDGNGERNYYTYDTENRTMQRFSGAVYTVSSLSSINQEKEELQKSLDKQIIIRNICIAVAALFAVLAGFLGYNISQKNEKIRKLRRRRPEFSFESRKEEKKDKQEDKTADGTQELAVENSVESEETLEKSVESEEAHIDAQDEQLQEKAYGEPDENSVEEIRNEPETNQTDKKDEESEEVNTVSLSEETEGSGEKLLENPNEESQQSQADESQEDEPEIKQTEEIFNEPQQEENTDEEEELQKKDTDEIK